MIELDTQKMIDELIQHGMMIDYIPMVRIKLSDMTYKHISIVDAHNHLMFKTHSSDKI